MKPPKFEYLRPLNLEEALRFLGDLGDRARPIAGGQSLIPMMSLRMAAPEILIDLTAIQSLRGMTVDKEGALIVGSMTRHSDVEFSSLVKEHNPLIHAAMAFVAHMAIRNRGTIGGSLAHADPSADWPALCIACDAELEISSSSAKRSVAARDFAIGIFSTVLEPGELITSIKFPAWQPGTRWGLEKISRRRGDFAIVGVAARLQLDGHGVIRDLRVVLYGATDVPTVAIVAEELLMNQTPSAELIDKAAAAISDAIEPGSDMHASAAYRRTLLRTLSKRALLQALPEIQRGLQYVQ